MKGNILCLIVLLLLATPAPAHQEQYPHIVFYNKIADAFKKNEPEWKMRYRVIAPGYLSINFEREKITAQIVITVTDSQAEADDVMATSFDQRGNFHGAKYSTTRLFGLGDEAYLVKDNELDVAIVFFRKGGYAVEVHGPSEDVVKRFSRLLVETFETLNKGK